jgi:hypothetical protein
MKDGWINESGFLYYFTSSETLDSEGVLANSSNSSRVELDKSSHFFFSVNLTLHSVICLFFGKKLDKTLIPGRTCSCCGMKLFKALF